MYKIMLSAGEASGDLNAASVARELKNRHADIRLFGMGGKEMAAVGVELVHDIADLGVFGIVEILAKLPYLRKVMSHLQDVLRNERPDVLVVVDYPGFHMRLAKAAYNMGIPVIYYITPSAWAWGKDRARKVANMTTAVAAIFPFEAEVYRAAGANVTFVGHPLLDIVKPAMSREQAYAYFGLDPAAPVVMLMPGSRPQEIIGLLPDMLQAVKQLKRQFPALQPVVPLATTIGREMVENIVSRYGIDVTITSGYNYDLMNIATLIIAASGTATLEAAIIGTPMMIVYRVASLTWLLGKLLVKIPDIGLPNIVAGRRIVPELIQGEANAVNMEQQAAEWLSNPDQLSMMRRDLDDVRIKLGQPGAVGRVADLILKVASAGGEQ